MDWFISEAGKYLLGFGFLGIYAVVVTVKYLRNEKKLFAVMEREILKRDKRREQEFKTLNEISETAETLLKLCESVDNVGNRLESNISNLQKLSDGCASRRR